MGQLDQDFNFSENADRCEISSSAAMLISVFGQPLHAEAELESMEWLLEFEGGGKAVIRNKELAHTTNSRIQTWTVSADSTATLKRVTGKLIEADNYYEGSLHPELFVKREKD
jgi:hypothetical protein